MNKVVQHAQSIQPHSNISDAKTVILLHGLARSKRAMQPMAHYLSQAGFSCHNLGYPSRKYNIATLATEHVLPQLHRLFAGKAKEEPHYFVTHSMGGIILRYLVAYGHIAPPKAVVMLAPPNHGSEIVDKLAHLTAFYWLNGEAGRELGTTPNSLPNQLNKLGAVNFNTGIITGYKSLDPWQLLLPSANDGKVTLASSKLAGMTDFLALPVSHTFIMQASIVKQQTLHFLQHGFFDHTLV